eukprot:TRINITY_DN7508_c0_g1_i2.p1 TRINITY_DN7508_c0_g1~~TRINITY_DN7508_c0_g1_i2.p1  ORF type:complete len:1685 (-),score=296.46 TRINITY_DN7508_c0_g1_i2:8-5062(-)
MEASAQREQQETEIEACQAIFQDDMVMIPPTYETQPPQFKLRMVPPPGVAKDCYASIWLIIRFTKTYPQQPPVIELEKIEGLSDEQIDSLNDALILKAKSLVPSEMVYELAEMVRDYLLNHNHKPLSFYEEMVMHREQEQKEARAREQQKQNADAEKRRKDEKALEEQIRKEFQRKESAMRKARRTRSDWLQFEESGGESSDEDEADFIESLNIRERPRRRPLASAVAPKAALALEPKTKSTKTEHEPSRHTGPANMSIAGTGAGGKPHAPIRWKRRNKLGNGTFGEVILGMNLGTLKLIAVKEIDFKLAPDPTAALERVESEIESLRGLQHHHIVEYLGTEKEGLVLRIFMEFVAGASSIASVLVDSGELDESMLRKYTRQILEGLSYLHERSIVHGDLKCLNMLLDHRGSIKLSDYGCSNVKIKGLLMGVDTMQLQPSDLVSGKQLDIFTVGLAVLEMATGKPVAESHTKPSHPPAIPSYLSEDTKDFLRLCLKRKAKDRASVQLLLHHRLVADVSLTNTWHMPGSPPTSHMAGGAPRSAPRAEFPEPDLIGIRRSKSGSRYAADFEELEELGKGAFGSVVKAKNRLDQRLYAIKKIKQDPRDHALNQKIAREVTTLSRLNHQYVVRYYQAWTEEISDMYSDSESNSESESSGEYSGSGDSNGWNQAVPLKNNFGLLGAAEDTLFGMTEEELGAALDEEDDNDVDKESDDEAQVYSGDDIFDNMRTEDNFVDNTEADNNLIFGSTDHSETEKTESEDEQSEAQVKAQILYIQMEYCPLNTLKQEIDKHPSEDQTWRLFRQILEGLNHIHLQGIIHRDLKPVNIFLDANGDIKIGDFGLATTGSNRVTRSDITASFDLNSSLTVGIGTPIYCSPEQQKEGAHYDQKVDLYSLGIILFEMCYPFATAGERAEVLMNLRKHVFPPGFEEKHPVEADLIMWLLQDNPNNRPTTMELLKSDLLPPKLEEEILKEAVRAITQPGTTIYSLLMEKLFTQVPDAHLDYTYEPHTGTKRHNTLEEVLREEICDGIVQVFQRHNAICLQTPLLMPKNLLTLEEGGTVWMLDDTGGVVQLPATLTVPFARFVAHSNTTEVTRYTIGKVYRRNPAGGQPREFFECDFDIVSPALERLIPEAEVIKATTEVLDTLQSHIGSYYIHINHHKIIEGILTTCDFVPEVHEKVCNVIERLNRKRKPAALSLTPSSLSRHGTKENYSPMIWITISRLLLTIDGVTQKSVDMLQEFLNMRGDTEETLTKLQRLLRNNKAGMEGIHDIRLLMRYLKAFHVSERVVNYDITLIHNFASYDGIVFHVMLATRHDLVAVGGRYDRLISRFRASTSSEPVTAVGVNIALSKLLSIYYSAERNKAKKEGRLVTGLATDVLVCSLGKDMLEQRMDIAQELWNKNIRTTYLHNPCELEELYVNCKQAGIPWMVILKDRSYDTTRMVRVKDVEKRTDTEMHRNELAVYMQRLKKRREDPAFAATDLDFVEGAPPAASGKKGAGFTGKGSNDGMNMLVSAESIKTKGISSERVGAGGGVGSAGGGGGGVGVSGVGGVGGTGGTMAALSSGEIGGDRKLATMLDVIVLNTDTGARKRNLIAAEANRNIGQRVTSAVNPRITKILASELPHNVVKDIAGCPPAMLHTFINKYKRYSEEISRLRNFLSGAQGKLTPLLFLYSIPDGKYEVMLVK